MTGRKRKRKRKRRSNHAVSYMLDLVFNPVYHSSLTLDLLKYLLGYLIKAYKAVCWTVQYNALHLSAAFALGAYCKAPSARGMFFCF